MFSLFQEQNCVSQNVMSNFSESEIHKIPKSNKPNTTLTMPFTFIKSLENKTKALFNHCVGCNSPFLKVNKNSKIYYDEDTMEYCHQACLVKLASKLNEKKDIEIPQEESVSKKSKLAEKEVEVETTIVTHGKEQPTSHKLDLFGEQVEIEMAKVTHVEEEIIVSDEEISSNEEVNPLSELEENEEMESVEETPVQSERNEEVHHQVLLDTSSPVFPFVDFVKKSRLSLFKNADIEEDFQRNHISLEDVVIPSEEKPKTLKRKIQENREKSFEIQSLPDQHSFQFLDNRGKPHTVYGTEENLRKLKTVIDESKVARNTKLPNGTKFVDKGDLKNWKFNVNTKRKIYPSGFCSTFPAPKENGICTLQVSKEDPEIATLKFVPSETSTLKSQETIGIPTKIVTEFFRIFSPKMSFSVPDKTGLTHLIALQNN